MKILVIILLCVGSICILCGLFMMLKNENTLFKRLDVLFAIGDYMMANRDSENDVKVRPKDMEPYTKTFWRFWDWGYKRILPKEKFKLIEPYLKKGGAK